MATKGQYRSGTAHVLRRNVVRVDVRPIAGVIDEDDFLGKAINTVTRWTAIDVSAAGLTTPVLVANARATASSLCRWTPRLRRRSPA
jgi:hypothetical protein